MKILHKYAEGNVKKLWCAMLWEQITKIAAHFANLHQNFLTKIRKAISRVAKINFSCKNLFVVVQCNHGEERKVD